MSLVRHPEIMRTAQLEEVCLLPSAYCLLFSEEKIGGYLADAGIAVSIFFSRCREAASRPSKQQMIDSAP